MKKTPTKPLSLIFFCLIASVTTLFNTALAFQTNVEEPEFTRVINNQGMQTFQVASVRYVPRTGGDRYVDLVGAVHIADRKYYQQLNGMFKHYDAVLFEAVIPKDAVIPAGGLGEKSGLSWVQGKMAEMSGLTFQLEEVNYTGKHFLHADLTPKEFKQSMDDKGETLFSMAFNVWRAGMTEQMTGQASMSNFDLISAFLSSDSENAMRKILATVLLDMDALSVLEGSEGSTIIAARNDKALKVLSEALKNEKNQSLAIFYGAGHLPDMHEKMLSKFDMVPISTQWLDAWDFK